MSAERTVIQRRGDSKDYVAVKYITGGCITGKIISIDSDSLQIEEIAYMDSKEGIWRKCKDEHDRETNFYLRLRGKLVKEIIYYDEANYIQDFFFVLL